MWGRKKTHIYIYNHFKNEICQNIKLEKGKKEKRNVNKQVRIFRVLCVKTQKKTANTYFVVTNIADDRRYYKYIFVIYILLIL